MAKIISLDDKLLRVEHQKRETARKRKLLAVKKVFQCTHCNFKCEKCGTQISDDESSQTVLPRNVRIPYRFCGSCAAEYIEYIDRLKGEGDPGCYWHNTEWLNLWQKWIDYQATLDRYMKSKEFLTLLKELKQAHPEE